jgi:hypothetical protein
MEKSKTKSQEGALKTLYTFVIKEMKLGADKATIVQKLVETGADQNSAEQAVGPIYDEVLQKAAGEQRGSKSLLPAIVGGALAAVVGGILWGLFVILTDYEIGFMAWGLGLLSGTAVVLLVKGRKGTPLQIIAVISSIMGIAVGKYVTFYHFLRATVESQYGAEVAFSLPLLSAKVIRIFFASLGSMLGGFDILWVILAIMTAWKIPKGVGVKLPDSYIPSGSID